MKRHLNWRLSLDFNKHQILNTNIKRNKSQTERRIAIVILEVTGTVSYIWPQTIYKDQIRKRSDMKNPLALM